MLKCAEILGDYYDLVENCNHKDNKIIERLRKECENLKWELDLLKFAKPHWNIVKDGKMIELMKKSKLR